MRTFLDRRDSAVIALGVAGLLSLVVGCALLALGSQTVGSILVGLAATSLAAALVDGNTLRAERRRSASLDRVAAHRIGKLHQRLLRLVAVIFDVDPPHAGDVTAALKDRPESPIDLETPAAVVPPRSRQVVVQQIVEDIDIEHESLVVLIGSCSKALDLEALDDALRRSELLAWAREIAPFHPQLATSVHMAEAASGTVAAVQRHFRAAAAVSGGSWRYGQL